MYIRSLGIMLRTKLHWFLFIWVLISDVDHFLVYIPMLSTKRCAADSAEERKCLLLYSLVVDVWNICRQHNIWLRSQFWHDVPVFDTNSAEVYEDL